ncbi:acyltransferase [Phlyctema vagabunda]|uniref:Tafazzin family protein n=1 Tax=Phlyctema vagabunda TaxID=108571 RepID=A0ABR4P273_9HELO
MGLTASISRGFLYGLNNMEVVGLDRFLQKLDDRKDVEGRQRGLITVSNHVSVLDDPLVWGVLPARYSFNPENLRWSLGSYDICFKNKVLSSFFTFGQVLPTHRGNYSPIHGGLFQPTMTQAIRLLSSQPFATRTTQAPSSVSISPSSPDIIDPFTTGEFTYSTTGTDVFPAPSAYPNRKHSWVHIFPEGRVHQHPRKTLRYFKWGVSRLILESEPMPDIVPMFIDGNQDLMPEFRDWPRFLPRVGKKVRVAFGDAVDGEKTFGDLRRRWQELVRLQKEALVRKGMDADLPMGELTDGLKYNKEAVALRAEVTKRIRMEVLKVRKSLGYPDEDPKQGLVETWIEEGGSSKGRMKDGSWVGET